MRIVRLLLAFALVAPALGAQAAYRFVTVIVTDAGSGVPLPGADITLDGVSDRSWSTDASGVVLVAAARDRRLTIRVRRIGYEPASVAPAGGDSVAVRVSLRQAVNTLDTSRVTAKVTSGMLAGFESRRERASGAATYFTADQIDKMHAIRTIDVVRRAIGVKSIDSSGILLIASSRGPKTIIGSTSLSGSKGSDLAPCVMRVAVDGTIREWGFSLDNIEPKEIHGVEVYPGPATIPVEFASMRRDAMCGLIMIWSKRGP